MLSAKFPDTPTVAEPSIAADAAKKAAEAGAVKKATDTPKVAVPSIAADAAKKAADTPKVSDIKPDITSAEQLKVAGQPVVWGSVLTVNASEAVSKDNGLCEFQIEHTIRNLGGSTTGSFRSLWTNSAVSGSWSRAWGSIAAGNVKSEKDLVPLKPKNNRLKLVLDDLHQVQESNEANNEFYVNVNVTGSCGVKTAPPVQPRMVPKQKPQPALGH